MSRTIKTNVKKVKRFFKEKRVEIVMSLLTVFFTVLVLTIYSCTPLKRTTATQTTVATDYTQAADDFRKQEQRLDLAIEMLSSTKEQINEWLNENIDYEEQRYDTLGRLTNSIKQTTNRDAGKAGSKTAIADVHIGLSVEQMDSILSARLDVLKSEIVAKEKVVEKFGLAWWQELLMWSGIVGWSVATFFASRTIIRCFWK